MTDQLVSIHQSNLFPRMKVLAKLAISDIYLTQNNVQFARRDWQNRFRVCGNRGVQLVSLPVHTLNGRGSRLCDVVIADPTSSIRIVRDTIRHTYRRAKYWPSVADYIEEVLDPPAVYLADLSARSVSAALERIAPQVLVADWQQHRTCDSITRSERLAKAVQDVGASAYLAGSGGRRYMDLKAFRKSDIRLFWQDWENDAGVLGLGMNAAEAGGLSVLHYLATVGLSHVTATVSVLRDKRRRQWDLEP